MLKLIDCHCHLPHYGAELNTAVEKLYGLGLEACLIGGVDPADWLMQEKLKVGSQDMRIFRSFGLHPWYVSKADAKQLESDFQILKKSIDKVDAIGEIGLDYAISKSSAERQHQMYWFKRQLDLALSCNKSVVVHVVRAHHDTIPVLKQTINLGPQIAYMVHSFTGNELIAQSYLDLNVFLSLSPKSLKSLKQIIISKLPLDRFTLESDAPSYGLSGAFDVNLTAKNHVESLVQLYQKVAEIRGLTLEELVVLNHRNLSSFLS